MPIVRHEDRPVLDRGPALPTLQRLVDRDNGAEAVTVLVNHFSGPGESVPAHTHTVEEVLVVVAGECTVTVGGQDATARTGDAVIVPPGVEHAIGHPADDPCTVVAVLGSPDEPIGGR